MAHQTTRNSKKTNARGLLEPKSMSYHEAASFASDDKEEEEVSSVSSVQQVEMDNKQWGPTPAVKLKLYKDLEEQGGPQAFLKTNHLLEELCNKDK